MIQGLKTWVREVMAAQGGLDAPAADEKGVPLDIDDVHMLLQGQSP